MKTLQLWKRESVEYQWYDQGFEEVIISFLTDLTSFILVQLIYFLSKWILTV
jgi:hypothetical protein